MLSTDNASSSKTAAAQQVPESSGSPVKHESPELRAQGGDSTAESQAAAAAAAAAATAAVNKHDDFHACSSIGHDFCLLLEHTTLECAPQHVAQLLQPYEERSLSRAELLVLLVYIVALECGYALESAYAQLSDELEAVPTMSPFHAQNVRRLSLTPLEYSSETDVFHMLLRSILALDLTEATDAAKVAAEQNEVDDVNANDRAIGCEHLLQSRLLAVASGDLLIVTLSPAPPSSERGFSVCLSIGNYVLNVKAKNKPLFHRFRQLKELSFMLREQLFYPLRAQQLALLDVQVHPTLGGLPAELYDEIFQHLSENQLNIVANVNRHLNYYSKHSKCRLAGVD